MTVLAVPQTREDQIRCSTPDGNLNVPLQQRLPWQATDKQPLVVSRCLWISVTRSGASATRTGQSST